MNKIPILIRDPEQIHWLKAKMDAFVQDYPNHVELFDLLVTQGGYAVAPVLEPDLTNILTRGYHRDGRGAKLMLGQRSGCHPNSAHLWDQNRDNSAIVTGWAMSDDGVWRQHSWVKHLGTGKIYETTEERLLYYGFDLTPDEAELFYDYNVG